MPDPSLAFPIGEYHDRLARARAAMRAGEIDVLVVTGPENICYLSGYHTTGYHVFQCLIVPAEREPLFVVRNIELGNVHARSWIGEGIPVFVGDDPVEPLADALVSRAGADARIGYEDKGFFLTPATVDALSRRLPKAVMVPASGVVEDCRVVKSDAEFDMIRRASEAASAGVCAGADACRAGATENDVAAAVYGGLVRAGSEYTGSPPFVAAGSRSATSHATYAMNRIRETDNVWLEVAGSVNRYHGAAGRVVAVGQPSDDVVRLSALAAEAVDAMIEAMRPGAVAEDVDSAGRSLVEGAGYGECWNNRGAYSLGLSFPPGLGEGHIMDIKPGDRRTIRAGMAFHLIPILKVPGIGAMGCTETVVVTDAGCESVIPVPRALIRR